MLTTPTSEINVGLCVRARVEGKWKLVSAIAPNRAVLPDGFGWYQGQRVKAEGRYYARLSVRGKNKWISLGKHRDAAIARRETIKRQLSEGAAAETIAVSGG